MHRILKHLKSAAALANKMTNDHGVLCSVGVGEHGLEVRATAYIVETKETITSTKLVDYSTIENMQNDSPLFVRQHEVLSEVINARVAAAEKRLASAEAKLAELQGGAH